MGKIIVAFMLAATLAGCDVLTIVTDGIKHAGAVADELEKATGMKPDVGFSWSPEASSQPVVRWAGVLPQRSS